MQIILSKKMNDTNLFVIMTFILAMMIVVVVNIMILMMQLLLLMMIMIMMMTMMMLMLMMMIASGAILRLYRLPIVVLASKLAGGTAGQLPTSSSSLQATLSLAPSYRLPHTS